MFDGQRSALRAYAFLFFTISPFLWACGSSGATGTELQFEDTVGGPVPEGDVSSPSPKADVPVITTDSGSPDGNTTNDQATPTDTSATDSAVPADAKDMVTADTTTPPDSTTDSSKPDSQPVDNGPTPTACEEAGVSEAGACDGNVLVKCVNDEPKLLNCEAGEKICVVQGNGTAACIFPPCEPQCDNKTCGSNGCDGVCGVCNSLESCENGQCVPSGPIGCSDCSSSEICVEDSCVPNPDCEGFSWEGCCSEGTLVYCQDGVIKEQNCNDEGCGWSENAGYYDCGKSGEGPAGFPIDCPQECTPQCDNKECGSDGCGSTCGECATGASCQSGNCVPQTTGCAGVPPTGYCEGTVKITCEGGSVVSENCALSGQTCWLDLWPLPPTVACKPLSLATCPGFLEDGYCSGNVLISCQGISLDIKDCKTEDKICAYNAGNQQFDCLDPD